MPVAYDDKRVIKPEIQHKWTQEMLEEYAKCQSSVIYFALNHARAIHPTKGIIPLEVRNYQLRLLDALDNYDKVLTLFPRQCGKSLTVSIYLLWLALYSEEPLNIFVLAHKGDMAKSLLADLKIIYEELPPYLKKGVKEYAKTQIVFEGEEGKTGSAIKIATTTADSIRGQSISFLLLDEFAFVPPHIVNDFYTALQPTLAAGGKVCIVSTPNGASGLFHELYKGAIDPVKPNGYKLVDVPWDEIPGRDEEFKEKQIRQIGKQRFLQEYQCVRYNTYINIRDKRTNKIYKVKVGDLYEGKDFL